jgi:CRP/FNR family transcriptional regulator, cyclic AMP receptor protein
MLPTAGEGQKECDEPAGAAGASGRAGCAQCLDDGAAGAVFVAGRKPDSGRRPDATVSVAVGARAGGGIVLRPAPVVYRGKMLFTQGAVHEGIYFIETGRIRVFYTAPSGREITLAYWNPGNFVGGPDVFGPGTHLWSGAAVANASVVHLPGKALKSLVTQIPSLAIGLIEGLSFKGKCYSALAQMLGTRSVTERLAHLLLHLADAYGVRSEEGIVIGSMLTHADIAHMVGATRQWVTISLKRLHAQGILTSAKSQIVIKRLDALAELRGSDA